MKKIYIETPVISACAVTECTYNTRQRCNARAITVGDGVHPGCDTYFEGEGTHVDGALSGISVAGVGACKVSVCRHNEAYECMADDITVGRNSGQIACMTFNARVVG